MGSIGPIEILVVLVVALLVLGPQKLPDAARSVGRAIGEVRRYTSGFQAEMRDAFAEPTPSTRPPPATAGETLGPTGESASATSEATSATGATSETTSATSETTVVPEPTDVVPAGERPMVADDLPPVTGNGDTPSA